MVRNAAIAAGNSGLPELIPVLERLTGDDDEVVAEAADWALARLKSSPAFAGEGDHPKDGGGAS